MTEKRVRLNQNVHEKLLHLRKKSKARSINDVIISLIEISEEFYINKGTLNVANKKVTFRYDNGKLIEIQIE